MGLFNIFVNVLKPVGFLIKLYIMFMSAPFNKVVINLKWHKLYATIYCLFKRDRKPFFRGWFKAYSIWKFVQTSVR